MHLITALKYIRKMLTDLKRRNGQIHSYGFFVVVVVLFFVGDFVMNLSLE